MPTLLCQTTGGEPRADHCRFTLDVPSAKYLLKLKAAHAAAVAALGDSPGSVSVETFYGGPDWGRVVGYEPHTDGWEKSSMGVEPILDPEENVELGVAVATDTGVYFDAVLKNADVHFETPEIPWDVVDEVAAGRPVGGRLLPVATIDEDAEVPGEVDTAALAQKCKEGFGFTPKPDCDNCNGTGYFELPSPTDKDGTACAFCLEDAIRAGELNGTVDGVEYVNGSPTSGTGGA